VNGWPVVMQQLKARGSLSALRELLEGVLAEEPECGLALLELGVVTKLQGEIEPAFALLRGALRHLPAEQVEARQRALFVLGLTHGDVLEPERAVGCFEQVEGLDPESRAGVAARGYASAYREHFGLR
jgi:tetratricopeptide (TPR) repeat protein